MVKRLTVSAIAALMLLLALACNSSSEVNSDGSSDADSDSDADTDADVDTTPEGTAGTLTVTVSTSDAGGPYRPYHLLAIWIENSDNTFVHTLMAYAKTRITHLNTWQASTKDAGSEYNRTDAVSGATLSAHDTRTATWDGTAFSSAKAVPDGTYKVCMELTDKDATGNHSCFEFEKGAAEQTVMPNNKSSFSDISIVWTPGL